MKGSGPTRSRNNCQGTHMLHSTTCLCKLDFPEPNVHVFKGYFISVCTFVWIHVHGVEVRGQWQVSSSVHSTSFLAMGLPLQLERTNLAQLAAQQASGILRPATPGVHCHIWLFTVVLGTDPRVSCLQTPTSILKS